MSLLRRLHAYFAADHDRVAFWFVVACAALIFFMGWPEVK